jgi:hypothetical protein
MHVSNIEIIVFDYHQLFLSLLTREKFRFVFHLMDLLEFQNRNE